MDQKIRAANLLVSDWIKFHQVKFFSQFQNLIFETRLQTYNFFHLLEEKKIAGCKKKQKR